MIKTIHCSNRVNHHFTRNALIAVAIMNIASIIVISYAFTNSAINNAEPVVMSNFGLVMIKVWGLAWLSAASLTVNI